MNVSWNPSGEDIFEAKEHAEETKEVEESNDPDAPASHYNDQFWSHLAEAAVFDYLREAGIDADWNAYEDRFADADISAGGLEIDVKARYTDNYPNPDLLIRHGDDTADVYVQVDVNRKADSIEYEITGWTTSSEAREVWSDFNYGNSSWKDKKLVDRNELNNPLSLITEAS